MTELHPLSGDVADLLDYRLDEHGMRPALWFPPVGNAYIAITCTVAGMPARFWPMPDELTPDIADETPPVPITYICPTCGSTDPDTIEGLPFCPDDYHYPETDWDTWRRIAYRAFAATVAALWLLALFLYWVGVLQQ